MNLTCVNGHQGSAELATVRPSDDLVAVVCPVCYTISWSLRGTEIDQWDGAMLGFGRALLLEKMAAVGAPGEDVLICRPPALGLETDCFRNSFCISKAIVDILTLRCAFRADACSANQAFTAWLS